MALKKYDAFYNKIRHVLSVKSGITHVISHNYAKIKIDLYDSLPPEKTSTLHVLILIKAVFNKDRNSYYFNTFLERKMFESIS